VRALIGSVNVQQVDLIKLKAEQTLSILQQQGAAAAAAAAAATPESGVFFATPTLTHGAAVPVHTIELHTAASLAGTATAG
jgi:hypothetical protein